MKPSSDWPGEGHVEFKGYTTQYRPGLNMVLQDLSADIRAGEKVRGMNDFSSQKYVYYM